MGVTGFELPQQSSANQPLPATDDAESDALSGNSALQTALDALAKLTPAQRAALAGLLTRGSEGGCG